MKVFQKIICVTAGVMALLALICAISVNVIVSENTMLTGFQTCAQVHEDNPSALYGQMAREITQYLNGKTDAVRMMDGQNAFSDKENMHLLDVRHIVTGLKICRYVFGGVAVVLLLLAWTKAREQALPQLVSGLADAAKGLLTIAAVICVWGLVNFDGLFYTLHLVLFRNHLWLLNPKEDLLIQLMPMDFFLYYAKKLLVALLPILGAMLLLPFADRKARMEQKKEENQ